MSRDLNCMDCQYDRFCCTLRVKLGFWDIWKLRIRGFKDFWESGYGNDKLIKLKDGKCYFLKDSRCRIYQLRPKACQEFPKGRSCREIFLFRKERQRKISRLD